ncbi:tyrosine-type recombinase/integrase [Undibacterium sp. Dicai25W]|uniref:tyrosine-type recombinase/integrase n=1 Tax=Undibacterium sp. Dicai25W TaxID=3413034 RepID=UPI003BF0379D
MPKIAAPLTDTQIRKAKPKEKTYTITDGAGMYIEIAPTGSKIWRMSFKQANGKTNRLTFGPYPTVTITEAREKRAEVRKQLLNGVDPSLQKKKEKTLKLVSAENTFEAVSWDWFKVKIEPTSLSHSKRTRAYLENDLIPVLGRLPFAEIKAIELLACLRKIESRVNNQGKQVTETANRVRTLMSGLWRYAIQTGKAERDIASDLKGALVKHVGENFSHIDDPKLLGELMRDIENYDGNLATRAALQLLPLVFSRPGELRQAKWVDVNLEAKEWRYVVTKTNSDHIVPLSDQAVEIIRSMKPLTGDGTYIFSVCSGVRPLSDGTMNKALKQMGYTSDVIQPHGFRHTAATALADQLGWDEEKIELQLSHKRSGVKGKYQKAKYLSDRREMMTIWSNYLYSLKNTYLRTGLERLCA